MPQIPPELSVVDVPFAGLPISHEARSGCMYTQTTLINVQSDQGRTLQVLPWETVVFKAVSADTEGACTVVEVTDAPQAGPPPHLHRREDEVFYILEGTFGFQIGDRVLTATAGCFLQAPKGVPHSYKNIGTTPARMLAMCVPAGIETFFEDLAVLTAASTLDLDHIAAVANAHGLELVV